MRMRTRRSNFLLLIEGGTEVAQGIRRCLLVVDVERGTREAISEGEIARCLYVKEKEEVARSSPKLCRKRRVFFAIVGERGDYISGLI